MDGPLSLDPASLYKGGWIEPRNPGFEPGNRGKASHPGYAYVLKSYILEPLRVYSTGHCDFTIRAAGIPILVVPWRGVAHPELGPNPGELKRSSSG